MADQVERWYYDTFQTNTILAAQQQFSKLRETVSSDWDTNGEVSYFNTLDTIADEEEIALGDDSPDQATTEDRVMIDWKGFRCGKLVSVNDIRKLLSDPSSAYLKAIAAAMGRRIDSQIITALGGSIYTGHAGGTATALPGGQCETTATGLTLDKIMRSLEILANHEIEIDTEEMITAVIGPHQWFVDLPKIDEFKNFNYFGGRPLSNYKGDVKLGNWLGVNWVMSNRLALPSYRSCYLYAKSKVAAAVRGEETRVTERADKNFRTYLWARHSIGASRLDNEGTVQMRCTES